MPKKVDLGVTRLAIAPGESPFDDWRAPEVAELDVATVRDVTCMVVSTYEVRFDGSDTTNERAVCQVNNVVTPTIGNYMGNLPLFRDWDETDPMNPDWSNDDVLEWLEYLDVFWFIRRQGFPYDHPWEDGQKIEVYKFLADNAQTNSGTGDGFLKAVVPLLQQGTATNRAVIGGEGS